MTITPTNPDSAAGSTLASYDASAGGKIVSFVFCETAGTGVPTGVTHGGNALTKRGETSWPNPPSGTTNYVSVWDRDGASGTGDVVQTGADGAGAAVMAVMLPTAAAGAPFATPVGDGVTSGTTLAIGISLSGAGVVLAGFLSGQATGITENQSGQNALAAEPQASSYALLTEKTEASSGTSTSGVDSNSGGINRIVGLLAGYSEAAGGNPWWYHANQEAVI